MSPEIQSRAFDLFFSAKDIGNGTIAPPTQNKALIGKQLTRRRHTGWMRIPALETSVRSHSGIRG
jgi:hypothetical protein